MKIKKTSIRFTLILLVTMTLIGCNSGGYRTTSYLNLKTDNPQEQLLNIGKFSGTKTDEWVFTEASEIMIECIVEKGSLNIALYDINNDQIFDKEVKDGEDLKETFNGEFEAGTYSFIITSRKAKGITIRLEFIE